MPTTTTQGSGVQGSRTERFAEYIRQAAREAGYDIDSPRGGAKKELARRTGMTQSSVGRMLAGQTMPDPKFLESLADALEVDLPELLVRSGLVSRRSALPSDSVPAAPGASALTPAEAAHRLGIHSPARVAMFESLVEHLLREESKEAGLRGVG